MAKTWYARVTDGSAALRALVDTGTGQTTLYTDDLLSFTGNASNVGGLRVEGGLFLPDDQLALATAADLQTKALYVVSNTGSAGGSMVGVTLTYNPATDQVSGAAV